MRFYIPLSLTLHDTVTLPDDVAHHLLRVLRAQEGDTLTVFNGEGGEFFATIRTISKKTATIYLESFNSDSRQSPLHTHLGQVMSRGDRMDYAIQKASELGVTEITPLTSERCELKLRGEERADKKLEHWQKIAISACEQCGRNIIPIIHPPISVSEWCQNTQADIKMVLALSATHLALPTEANSVALLIGPEGGLSEAEIQQAEQAGFKRWQLGSRVFRTETAPIVALSLLQQSFGGF